mmetsp:Transcript_67906/g.107699  ORF Transcript_67906/g.107699 Transcript_67906/m.107699 type:complete len:510 (-) Transcript_67906:81-1610(-)
MWHVERIDLFFWIAVCLVINTASHSIESQLVHYGNHSMGSSVELSSIQLPILRLIDLSLDKWGSKIAVSPKIGNFTGYQAISPTTRNFTGWDDKQFLSEKPANSVRFAASAREQEHSSRFFLVFAACVFVLLCLAGVMYMFENETEDDYEDRPFKSYSQLSSEKEVEASPTSVDMYGRGRREVESPARTVNEPDGSWVRAYREATGPRKAALELLFKCQIISNQEFLYSRVSQEHIDECVWVGNFMLQQKSLEEWERLWQQAQQTFEDSVTQCFTARTDARSFGPVPPLDCQSARQLEDGFGEDLDDYLTTRNTLASEDGLQSPSVGNDSPLSPQAENRNIRGRGEKPVGEFPERGLSPIITRCRMIRDALPQEGVPRQNPSVVRSSSIATTVTAMPASRQSSVAQISPTPTSREPVDVSREREPQPWIIPERSREPVDVSVRTLPESASTLRPDSRTSIQADSRTAARPGPIALFPTQSAQPSPPYRPPVQLQARSGDTSPVSAHTGF